MNHNKNKKKVWIINQYALPKGTAGITRHGDFAHVLNNLGYEVTVFASNFDNFQRKEVVSQKNIEYSQHDGVNFVWLKTPAYQGNDGKRIKNMLAFFFKTLFTLSLGREGRPDIIIGSSPHLLSALAGSLLSTRFNVPFLLELRDVWPEDLIELGALKENSMTHKILNGIANHLYHRADHILSVPPKLHNWLADKGIPIDKITPLPNGVFANEKSEIEMPESLKAIFDSEEDKFKVLYMGAHGVANKLGNIVDTASFIREHRPEQFDKLAFILVGGGQEKEKLIAQAKKQKLANIHFHEPVSKAAVNAAMQNSDALLVHLAAAETFSQFGRSPNKLYDYLKAGKAVLFSTLDSETVVDKARAGYTFKPENPEDFASVLDRLMNLNQEQYNQLGKNGQEIVKRQYDLEYLGQRLASVIEATISRKVGKYSANPANRPSSKDLRPG